MERTVVLAKKNGIAVGAHPGYPDLAGFGRRNLSMSKEEARTCVMYQVGALQAFLKANGMNLQHVKLHGALYNTAAKDYDLSLSICKGIASIAPDTCILGLSGSCMLRAAEATGLRAVSEVFADRAYNDDGTLVSRKLPGAVLHDTDEAIERTIQMAKEGTVRSISGKIIPIKADSVCVHGDNASALEFVKRIRTELEQAGIRVMPFGQ